MNSTHVTAEPRRRLDWARKPELALVALMAMVIGMLIIPMPTFLVDLLIGLNIAISILIFLSSFYIERILKFSTFPSVLLFTTLMRLALSISTSRLILVDADAGHIIQAFGDFVIADNLVVGFVVFAIVTIVQFIVITKGSERVGEVAARFSLDGMPGKQMSIDADLKAGTLDAAGAQKRRSEVERESQLYGSFDGAMKFVKGDAIAGIVILFVNLIGGISVGVLQQGMSFHDAVQTFTLLTIGDGLVAQIPALLICISAGFIVTRVSGDSKNLGDGIITELFANNTVLVVSGVLVLLVGLLPGFPLHVFVVLSAGLFGLFYMRRRKAESKDPSGTPRADGQSLLSSDKKGDALDNMINETMALILVMPPGHVERWEKSAWASRMKDDFFLQFGMRLPQLAVRSQGADGAHTVSVLINEVVAARADIVSGRSRVIGGGPELEALDLNIVTTTPAPGKTALWVDDKAREKVLALGGDTRTDFDELFKLVSESIFRNVNELFGIQETKNMLDDFERKYPELVKEAYRHMPVQRLAEVFQRLLREGISIRNMKVVLEALAQWAAREKDVILLVEHARGALARYISARFAPAGRLAAVAMSPNVEDVFRSGIRQSQGSSFLNLEPAKAEEMLDRILLHVGEATRHRADVVLLTSPDIRRFVKRFIETRLPDLPVLSFGEISDTVTIDVVRSL